MTDTFFSFYATQVVLEKKDVPDSLLDVLRTEPIVLPAYDPMGALA